MGSLATGTMGLVTANLLFTHWTQRRGRTCAVIWTASDFNKDSPDKSDQTKKTGANDKHTNKYTYTCSSRGVMWEIYLLITMYKCTTYAVVFKTKPVCTKIYSLCTNPLLITLNSI